MQGSGEEVPACRTEVLFRTLVLPVPQALAFELFTAHAARWWSHAAAASPNDVPWVDIVLGTELDSRWFERDKDGVEHDWGRVTEVDAPVRIAVAWNLKKWVGNTRTELALCFVKINDQSTRLTLEHCSFEVIGDQKAKAAQSIAHGWDGLLPRYARYCRNVAAAAT
jgi:uncharacterized protein YndB with AHSA1/START domain